MKKAASVIFSLFIISAVLSTTSLNAQTKAKFYDNDLGLTVGVNVPMYSGIETDATVGITYGHFSYSGLGFRTGFQYTPSIADIDNSFGIPIEFAYRTRSRSKNDRFRSGMYGAASAAYQDIYYSGMVTPGNVLFSFLTSLISDVEFTAGITPGFVEGGSSSGWSATYYGNHFEKGWTERSARMSLTLDAGACLNYSIWRFDIKLMPAFHYDLTNNYIRHKTSGSTSTPETTESTLPVRWFFTFSGGLAFRF